MNLNLIFNEHYNISENYGVSWLYEIYKFNNQGSDYNYLQHHLEARPDGELGDGDTYYEIGKYQPRLKLGAAKFNCALENKDFIIKNDGSIEWIS